MFDTNFSSPFAGPLAKYLFASLLTDKVITIQKFGERTITGNIAQDIWDYPTSPYPYIDMAVQLSCVSTSANDAPGLAGISVVEINGLDADWNLLTERVTLNGTTPVLTAAPFIRVFRVSAISSGVGDHNTTFDGSFTASAGADVQAHILTGGTTTKMSMFSIPVGYTGFINYILVTSGPNDDFIADLQSKEQGNVFRTGSDLELANNEPIFVDFSSPAAGPFVERSDIKFKAENISPNSSVRVNYSITLVKTSYLAELALFLE